MCFPKDRRIKSDLGFPDSKNDQNQRGLFEESSWDDQASVRLHISPAVGLWILFPEFMSEIRKIGLEPPQITLFSVKLHYF